MHLFAGGQVKTVAFALLVAMGCRPTDQDTTDPSSTTAEVEELSILYQTARGDPARLEPIETRLQRLLADEPDHPEALLLLANVQLERGRPEDALASAKHCVEAWSEHAGCWLVVAVLEEQRGANVQALAGYRNYVELTPEGRNAASARAAIQRLEGATGTGSRRVVSRARVNDVDANSNVDANGIKAQINRRVGALRDCYERVLRLQPGLAGMTTFTIGIAADGHVTRVDVPEDTVGSNAVSRCARERIEQWTFGPQSEGGEVTFRVVFSEQ